MHKALQKVQGTIKALMNTQIIQLKKNAIPQATIQLFHNKAAPFEFQV